MLPPQVLQLCHAAPCTLLLTGICFCRRLQVKQTTVAVQPMICRHLDIDAMIGVAKFLDGVASPTFVVDGNGKISSWNRKMHRLSGLSSDEVCERSLSEFLDSSSSNWENGMRCVLSVDDRADAQDLIDVSDCRVKLKQSSISFRIKISANRDKSSLILGAICLASDFSSSTDSSDADNSKHTDATNASILNISLSNQPDTEKNELNRMINSSCAPIFGLDTEGNVNEWNASMATITRMEDSIALGKSFSSEFVAVEYREAFLQILASVLETGTGNPNLEFELAPEINETQCLLVAMNTRLDRNGRVVGVRCMAHDVTEATKRNRVVSAMANELRQLIDTANSPIFGNDNDGNINEWNDMTAQITGFSKEEVMGRSLTEAFIAPNTKTAVQDHLSLSSTGHVMPNFDLDLCTKLGDIRHLLVNATTRRDAENNIIGVVAVAQDVTEAVLRDRAVAGMAFELRQLIDTANAPIFGCDVDFNVNEWNRRTEDITGYLKEDAFGLPIVATFIATSMQSKVQEILLAALHGNETTNYELEFIAKSGETKLLLVNATTRRDPEGNVVGVVGVAQDATEDRKQAAELRKMQILNATQEAKMETERHMTDYFAHELRNPLSAIDSALQAMPDNLPDSAMSLVTAMQMCVRFMSSIMDNLLDVRRMEEGKVTLEKAPFSLSALLAEVRAMISPSVKPGVLFHTECNSQGRDWVLGDERRIHQMITNVMTNAVRYTVSGSISINISWDDNMVKLMCIDTGPGITKSGRQNLYQRFVERGGAPGTGIGLAITKHLVDLAGGTIVFESDPSVAVGTTCKVHLPLTSCESPCVESREGNITRMLVAPLRFLIIDDVKMNRIMLKRRIQKKICPQGTITEASTGEQALEICGTEQFDIIIVDQYMEEAGGVMVGTDVVHAMRRMRIDSIIIGCSGNDLDAEFGEAGVDWVWQKPMPSNEDILKHLYTALALKNKL